MAESETDRRFRQLCSKFRPKLTRYGNLPAPRTPFLASAVRASDPFPATSVGAPEISVSGNLCATKLSAGKLILDPAVTAVMRRAVDEYGHKLWWEVG